MLLTTGATNRNSVLEIYDFAGNLYEWTLEKAGNVGNPCSPKGGSYNNSGDATPAAYHGFASTSNSSYIIGLRPALW